MEASADNRWFTLIEWHGFTADFVQVQTEDRYIVTLLHITSHHATTHNTEKHPVLLIPGLFDDGARWLEMQSEHSSGEQLPMIL